MKALTIASALLLLFAGRAASECRVVESLKVQPSSTNIRITALINGKPQQAAKVEFFIGKIIPDGLFTTRIKPNLTVATNEQGLATVSGVTPGSYHVVVAAAGTSRADLYLEVSANPLNAISSFSVSLWANDSVDHRTIQERVAAAELLPPSQKIKSFKGAVTLSPDEGTVSGTEIVVWRQGFSEQPNVVQIMADDKGQFSANLKPGTYIAAFQTADYLVQVIAFEIADDGQPTGLRISVRAPFC